jgi:hypothetical protein
MLPGCAVLLQAHAEPVAFDTLHSEDLGLAVGIIRWLEG